MANKKINDLDVAGAIADAMQLESDIGGTTANRITTLQVKNYTNAGLSGGKTIEGGTGSAEGLTLDTTSNATKGLLTINSAGTLINDTSYLQAPSGTVAQRPGSPVNAMLRYNSDNNTFEFYQNGAWVTYLTDALENLWDRELISGSDYRLNPHNDLNDRINTSTAYQIGKVDVLSVKGSNNTCIGEGSDGSLTTGQDNVFAGHNAGANTTDGSFNCYLGFESGKTGTSSQFNTAFGYKTLTSITNASNNTVMGNQCGAAITSGGYNILIGTSAGVQTTTASNIIAIGRDAGRINNANYLIAIGYQAGRANLTSTGNIYVGKDAGLLATGANNTVIGYETASALTTGGNNTLYGYQTGLLLTTQTGNIHLGYQAGSQSTDSNKLFIDNSNTTTPLIGGDFSANTLNFRGIASYYAHPSFSADTEIVDKKYVDDHPGAATVVYDDLSSQIIVGGETSFTITSTPNTPGEALLFRNGLKQYYGSGNDFTISGTTLTYNHSDLVVGEVFEVFYDYSIGGAPLSQDQIYYVGDAGDDSYSGLNYHLPVKTLAKAITLINAQTPSSSNRFEIQIIGGVDLTENVTIPTHTKLVGDSTKITGTLTLSAESDIRLKQLVVPNSANGLVVNGVSAYAKIDKITGGTSSAGAYIHSSGTLKLDCQQIDLSGSGSKVYNATTGAVLYINGGKVQEQTASTGDASETIFKKYQEYVLNAGTNDTVIFNETGKIIIDAKGSSFSFKDSATGEVITNVGAFPKFTNTPNFEAFENAAPTSVTGDGTLYTVIFNNEQHDIGSDYNNTTGEFTAATTGDYFFTYTVALTSFGAHTQLEVFLSADVNTFYAINVAPANIKTSNNEIYINGSHKVRMSAASKAKVQVRVSGSTKAISLKGANFSKFSGYLLTAS